MGTNEKRLSKALPIENPKRIFFYIYINVLAFVYWIKSNCIKMHYMYL